MSDEWPGAPINSSSSAEWPGSPIKSEPGQSMALADMGKSAIASIPSSALEFGKSMIQPIIHPVETVTALKNVGQGVLEKTGLMSGSEHVPYADAMGQFFVDRYGSLENAKHTLAHDPVGVAADLSTVLTGGGTLAARAPGIIGRAAEAVGSVGRMVDPLTVAGKGVTTAGKVGAGLIGELGTQTGGEALRTAAQAGYEGGRAGRAFQQNLRGAAGAIDDTVADASQAVRQMRAQRGAAYQSAMQKIGADTTVLDFNAVDNALHDAQLIKTYKGQNLSPTAEGINKQLMEEINKWRALDPAEYHTAEGLDALKQKIGDIRDGTAYGTPERVAANKVYGAVRDTIIKQVPEYAKVMKGYEEASKQIKEIERTLSLNPNASIDTSLRKLQSVLRNNVNSNYGRRRELADFLVQSGAPHLMEKLSGQMLSSWSSRGLGRLGMQLGAEIGLMGLGAHVAGTGGMGLAALGTLPMMSPRLMGEAAYYTGKIARHAPIRPAAQSGFQIGRTEEQPPRAAGGRVIAHNINPDPTEAQKEAGNYAKDHVRVHGLDITIENAKGSERSGVAKGGKSWSVPQMPAHYGYIKRTEGSDGDHVDCYLGPHIKSPNVFIVDQMNADSRKFDEHKCFIGFASKQAAINAYHKAFSDGRGRERLGHVTEMGIDQFKHWLGNGDTTKPADDHQAVKIVRKYDVPYLAGASNDGKTVYIDRRVPLRIKVRLANGKGFRFIDPAKPLSIHEIEEWKAMTQRKMPYLQAHTKIATPAEHEWLTSHGLDWRHYEEILDGLLNETEHEKPKRPPADLYLKPYCRKEHKLLAREEKQEAA